MGLESPRPQYRQLADLIRAAIDRGEYAPGSLLPSEDELARRYNVSRPTVNRAMSILRSEGLIRVERGRGTIVRDLPVIRRDAVARQRIRKPQMPAARSRPSWSASGSPPAQTSR